MKRRGFYKIEYQIMCKKTAKDFIRAKQLPRI